MTNKKQRDENFGCKDRSYPAELKMKVEKLHLEEKGLLHFEMGGIKSPVHRIKDDLFTLASPYISAYHSLRCQVASPFQSRLRRNSVWALIVLATPAAWLSFLN